MISGRTVVLLGIAASSYWLWSSGEWRTLASRVPALASVANIATPSTVVAPATGDALVPAPLQVRTWIDAQGVAHFEQAGAAPQDASEHVLGSAGTMADYERALAQQKGITMQDIARARAARTQTAEAKAAVATTDDGADTATRQAYELLRRYEQNLERIRATNNE